MLCNPTEFPKIRDKDDATSCVWIIAKWSQSPYSYIFSAFAYVPQITNPEILNSEDSIFVSHTSMNCLLFQEVAISLTLQKS